MTARRKVLSMGIVADLQYANIDDGFNWDGSKKRYYRTGLSLVRKAMKDWKQNGVKFVLQLGDIIDGFCRRTETPDAALNRIVDAIERETPEKWPVFHVVGNHELYNFTKKEIYSSRLFKTLPSDNKAYYSSEVHPGLKVCGLNTYEYSNLGEIEGTEEYLSTHELLKQHNPNEDKNDPTGLQCENKRFVRFNGGVSKQQLDWLEAELLSSIEKKQNVIVIGHNPVFLPATDTICLCWNCFDVHRLLCKYSECVVCYISGHDHDGGYAVDDSNIHHITMKGVIEHPESYALGTFYEDQLIVEGRGEVEDMTMPLRYQIS